MKTEAELLAELQSLEPARESAARRLAQADRGRTRANWIAAALIFGPLAFIGAIFDARLPHAQWMFIGGGTVCFWWWAISFSRAAEREVSDALLESSDIATKRNNIRREIEGIQALKRLKAIR